MRTAEIHAIDCAPDWTRLAATVETMLGVRVRVVPSSANVVTVQARSIGGAAHVWFDTDHVECEAPLDATPYFLAHLHAALGHAGAKPTGSGAPEESKLTRLGNHGTREPLRAALCRTVARSLLTLADEMEP